MSTAAITLDEATLARARQLAAQCHCTVEELLCSLVQERSQAAQPAGDDLIGFLADEPEVVDLIMDDVYRTRETQALRTPANGSRAS